MKPDPSQYNPDPAYFRDLVASTGLSAAQVGKAIGHDKRTVNRWISGETRFSYAVQFTLEALVLSPD